MIGVRGYSDKFLFALSNEQVFFLGETGLFCCVFTGFPLKLKYVFLWRCMRMF